MLTSKENFICLAGRLGSTVEFNYRNVARTGVIETNDSGRIGLRLPKPEGRITAVRDRGPTDFKCFNWNEIEDFRVI